MPKIAYESKNFRKDTLAIIEHAYNIVEEYQVQGFSLTLRQLYYQFVARGLLANTESNYNKLGNIVSDARRAGLIDWNAIEDRTRYIRNHSSWDTPQEILKSAKDSYHRDLWENQDARIEVWIEKDALVGVIQDVCTRLDVPYFSCRGYVSDSEMWGGAMRIIRHFRNDQNVIILHLGDHDPSGIDMTRDITERLSLFSSISDSPHWFEVNRIALTMAQVEEVNPPPNPAKVTDSRYDGYVARYGNESWELDALEPQYLVDLIEEHIFAERDIDRWEELYNEQETERQQIQEIIDKWSELF